MSKFERNLLKCQSGVHKHVHTSGSAHIFLNLSLDFRTSANGSYNRNETTPQSCTSRQSFFLCVIAPQFSQAPFRNLVAAGT